MAPREVVPGRTILVTRRCTQRQFLLRPDPIVEQIYLYCLAVAAARFSITIYAWVAMSNHHHALIRDNLGNYPQFLEHLHKLIARAMNAYRGRRENFWASEQANAVWTVEPVDSFDKLVYVLANPVAEHLVDRVADWPGASSLHETLVGTARFVKRPRVFFREDGAMPEVVELRAERLEGFAHLSASEWKQRVLEALEKAERGAREERRAQNRGVVGRKNVLRVPTDTMPSKSEARGRLRPTVACKNRERRILELGLLRAFRIAYRAALALWRAGDHHALFPSGTYKMRWFGAETATAAAA